MALALIAAKSHHRRFSCQSFRSAIPPQKRRNILSSFFKEKGARSCFGVGSLNSADKTDVDIKARATLKMVPASGWPLLFCNTFKAEPSSWRVFNKRPCASAIKLVGAIVWGLRLYPLANWYLFFFRSPSLRVFFPFPSFYFPGRWAALKRLSGMRRKVYFEPLSLMLEVRALRSSVPSVLS